MSVPLPSPSVLSYIQLSFTLCNKEGVCQLFHIGSVHSIVTYAAHCKSEPSAGFFKLRPTYASDIMYYSLRRVLPDFDSLIKAYVGATSYLCLLYHVNMLKINIFVKLFNWLFFSSTLEAL